MKLFKKLFFVVLCLLSWQNSAEEVFTKEVVSANQAVWSIQNNEVRGSGFFISPTLFVTSFHIVNHLIAEPSLENTSFYLRQESSLHTLKIKGVRALSVKLDLALLETEPVSSYLTLRETDLDNPDEELFLINFSDQIYKKTGQLQKHFFHFIFPMNYSTLEGSSGGPIIDHKGQVVGVVTNTRFNLVLSTNLDSLRQFIEESQSHPLQGIKFEEYLRTAMTSLIIETEDDDPVAHYQLAEVFLEALEAEISQDANEIRENTERALEYLEKSAQQGYWQALIRLTSFLEEENPEESFKWAMKGAEQGFAPAKLRVALTYLGKREGIEKPPNKEKEGLQWLHEVAEMGYAPAQSVLHEIYLKGDQVERNEKTAFQWAMRAAEQGYHPAQFDVTMMYLTGNQFVERNEKTAFQWAMKGAEQGYQASQYLVASMYAKGQGVPPDLEEAHFWMNKAQNNLNK